MIRAYAAHEPAGRLERFDYDPGELQPGQVEIDVIACGICHSDLSMLENQWQMSGYPLVPGHEVVGTVAAVGEGVTNVSPGDTVGLGWYASSCMTCHQCMSGDHNLCADAEGTIVGRFGGFADKVRCSAEWAIPLPDGVDAAKAGPLFCGGITVFNPIVQFGVKPTHRVGVIGIGGLGHLALQFLAKWGCEVTAFTSTGAKADEARSMGAHNIVNSRDASELEAIAGSLDFILSTVNVDLDWESYLATLGPRGRLHTVGAAPSPIPVAAFGVIPGQKSVSGSPLGSPATTAEMLDFCARHGIEAVTEHFPMSRVNEAFDHLRAGKARYRIVLENDLD
jgi:uncharacterized zinc-type alcohol dehydrogenase-like protein